MTAPATTVVLSGDLTAEVAAQAAALLRSRPGLEVEAGQTERSAGLIPTAEVLSIASCLAGVLSFLFTTWTAWRDRRVEHVAAEQTPAERARALRAELAAFQAEGYEVDRIQIDEDLARPGTGTATIVLRDVPGRQLIVVDAAADDRVAVRRQPTNR